MKHNPPHRGFIALMSVILMGAILLVSVYLLSASTFLGRFDALDIDNKRVSLGLAEACVNAAILKLAQGDYTTGKVTVDSSDPNKTCEVCQITSGGAILTRAVYNKAYTNLQVAVDTTDTTYPVTSWGESASYSGPSCSLP